MVSHMSLSRGAWPPPRKSSFVTGESGGMSTGKTAGMSPTTKPSPASGRTRQSPALPPHDFRYYSLPFVSSSSLLLVLLLFNAAKSEAVLLHTVDLLSAAYSTAQTLAVLCCPLQLYCVQLSASWGDFSECFLGRLCQQ